MKSNVMFNFDLLYGDHMAKVSNKAKLYYIKLNFYANNGFVPNPLSVLDSMGEGYDKSVYQELVNNGELLTLPDRSEVFITSYFVHNHFSPSSWTHTIYYPYWKGKLYTKKNGVATFTPQGEEQPTEAQKLDAALPVEEINIKATNGRIDPSSGKIEDDLTDEEFAKLPEEEQIKYVNSHLPF